MLVRAQPFKNMPYHDKTRTDFIVWRTPYCTIPDDDLDLTREDHVAQLGYGRVVLLFECAVAPNSTTHPLMQQLAFIEELWRYSGPRQQKTSWTRSTDALCCTGPRLCQLSM